MHTYRMDLSIQEVENDDKKDGKVLNTLLI
jgi:hypothetical protein